VNVYVFERERERKREIQREVEREREVMGLSSRLIFLSSLRTGRQRKV
jgi:hypothetical protein